MEKVALPTKQQVISEVVELLGIPPITVGAGSSIPSVFFTSIAQEMGIPIRGSMPSLAREIIERNQLTWHDEFSSETSPSGGGSTVTVLGLLQIKNAVLAWSSLDILPLPDGYIVENWRPPDNWREIREELPRDTIEVLSRPNSDQLRRLILDLYNSKCSISGCSVVEVLEIAHIVPYFGPVSDKPQNVLPMRVDLHRLFDAGLLRIVSNISRKSYIVEIHDKVLPHYGEFHMVPLHLPEDRSIWPSMQAIEIKNELHKQFWQEI